ncbi:hypothetical protein K492DRAFT_39829 [Lichtheimia hyalospora FSU 10163]|nr:hypothetical protein K492DRAFT_39829 [Lichtheimia hyalospora FSU 10163]
MDQDEFSNVAWDMQDNDKHDTIDPLSDITDSLSQPTLPPSIEHEPSNGDPVSSLTSIDVQQSSDPLVPSANMEKSGSWLQDDNKLTLHDNAESSSSPFATRSQDQPQQHTIQVSDPRKENDYISYRIISPKSSVRRRFQDFVWLYNVLYTHFPACFVPPLPDKHRMEYVKGDRFSSDFIERRRVSLQRYLQRIARHPILQKSEFFIMFLESPKFNDASARALRESQETMMDTISDSLVNAFVKIRKKDERFVEMKDRVDRLQENMSLLEKTLLRTNKRTEDMAHDYKELASSMAGLAEHENRIGLPLGKFATGLLSYSQHMKDMATHDGMWLSEVHDFMAYYNVVKSVLKLRDQKQLDFEELSDYLQATITEREKTLHPRPGEGGSYNLTGYFTGKLNEVRGADADKIRREKVLRLDDQIRELQDAVEQTHQVSTGFSEQVKREDGYLARTKSCEMREALSDYTNAKVDFYQQCNDMA